MIQIFTTHKLIKHLKKKIVNNFVKRFRINEIKRIILSNYKEKKKHYRITIYRPIHKITVILERVLFQKLIKPPKIHRIYTQAYQTA